MAFCPQAKTKEKYTSEYMILYSGIQWTVGQLTGTIFMRF
jgi:hypothetical protein